MKEGFFSIYDERPFMGQALDSGNQLLVTPVTRACLKKRSKAIGRQWTPMNADKDQGQFIVLFVFHIGVNQRLSASKLW